MRKNFGPKPWVYPLPVLIVGSYDADGTPDAMNAAWGGIYNATHVILSLSAGHKSTQNILARGAFTVSFATVGQLTAADYVGIVSANDTPDKVAKAGWHAARAEHVDAPYFEELPLTLECRLTKQLEDGNLVGEIVNVSACPCILTEDGNIDPAKLQAISFDPANGAYLAVGETVGKAFADGAKLK